MSKVFKDIMDKELNATVTPSETIESTLGAEDVGSTKISGNIKPSNEEIITSTPAGTSSALDDGSRFDPMQSSRKYNTSSDSSDSSSSSNDESPSLDSSSDSSEEKKKEKEKRV